MQFDTEVASISSIVSLISAQGDSICEFIIELEVNGAALTLFQKQKTPFSILAACGDYRTGKSFLLNSLFSNMSNGNHFEVSSTTEPCTKGIILNKIYSSTHKKDIWILDTQGFSSFNRDSLYDSKIFLLLLLLSDTLIYNSMGAIDEDAIAKLAMISQQATCLANNELNVRLYWVLRDFSLCLTNTNGEQLSPNEYLQKSLSEEMTKAENGKIQRKIIKNTFKFRQCIPLIRPCISQKLLSSLHEISSNKNMKSELREQFVDEINDLRHHLLANLQIKSLKNGEPMSGFAFAQYIRRCVDLLNTRDFGGLTVRWEQIMQIQSERILSDFLQKMKKILNNFNSALPLNCQQQKRLTSKISKLYLANHSQIKAYSIQEVYKQKSEQLLSKFYEKNSQILLQKCEKYSNQQTEQLNHKLIHLSNLNNFNNQFQGQIHKIQQTFLRRFSSFFYSSEIENKAKLTLNQKLLTNFEKIIIALTSKWKQQLNSCQAAVVDLKKVNYNLTQQIKVFTSESQISFKQQINRLKNKNKELMANSKNYGQIIQRMQSVNGQLKNELQCVAENEKKLQIELQKQKYQRKSDLINWETASNKFSDQNLALSTEIEVLNKKVDRMEIEAKNASQEYSVKIEEHKERNQALLKILQNERSQYQELMGQWREIQAELKQQMQQKEETLLKVRAEYAKINQNLKEEIEQMIQGIKIESQKSLRQKQERLTEIKGKFERQLQKNEQLEKQREIHEQELKKIVVKLKNEGSSLQIQINELNLDLERKIEEIAELENKLHLKETELSDALVNQRNLKQQQNKEINLLTKKLKDYSIAHESSTKNKFSSLQKEFEVEKKEIVSKLNEAAERIEKMRLRQIKMQNELERCNNERKELKKKVHEFQQREIEVVNCLQCLKFQSTISSHERARDGLQNRNQQLLKLNQAQWREIEELKKKLQSNCEMDVSYQQEIDLQKRLSSMNLSNNKEQRRIQKLEQSNKLLSESLAKRQQTLKESIDQSRIRISELIAQNTKLRCFVQQVSLQVSLKNKCKQEPSLEYNLHPDVDSLVIELKSKMEDVVMENKKLKVDLEEERQRNDKFQRESLKSINFHALAKKFRVEEIDKMIKENAELKISAGFQTNNFEIQSLKKELHLKDNEIAVLKEKCRELQKAEKQMLAARSEQMKSMARSNEKIVMELRASKDELRYKMERQIAKHRQEKEAIEKDQQFWRNQYQLLEKQINTKAAHHETISIKNYRDRVNNLFN